MIYGAINKNAQNYCLNFKKVLDIIVDKVCDYNWLITDVECYQSDVYNYEISNQCCWLTGENLKKSIQNDVSQWIWGVFSAFEKNISLDEILDYELPYANGYEGFWKNPLTIQHPLACIEVVAWDGYMLLVFSKDDQNIIEKFYKSCSEIENLSEYNLKF